MFLNAAKSGQRTAIDFPKARPIPEKPNIKKALMLGSGGLSIGQAGEFDYSGSQARFFVCVCSDGSDGHSGARTPPYYASFLFCVVGEVRLSFQPSMFFYSTFISSE